MSTDPASALPYMNGTNVAHVLDDPASLASTGGYRVEILPATVEHVYQLAPRLRQEDAAEVIASGHGVKRALWRGFRSSVLTKVALVDDEIAAMWGLCLNWRANVSLLGDLGVPWLLTSGAIERIPILFVRQARKEVAQMRKLRPRLESYVAARYERAVRFLPLLGFTVDPPAPLGVDGEPFSRFHLGF